MYLFSVKSLLSQVTSCPAISNFIYQELLGLEPLDVQNMHFQLVPSKYTHDTSL